MKFVFFISLASVLFSLSGRSEAIACSKDRQCSKDELIQNINTFYDECRAKIASIDNVKKDVFEPNISIIHIRTRSALKELNKKLDFSTYLNMINDLKANNVKTKTQTTKMVNEWTDLSYDGINRLGLKVSEELRASASFCAQPVSVIQEHINKLKETAAGKTK